MASKMVLGKGIASLIKETPAPVVTEALKSIEPKVENNDSVNLVDINQIFANPKQPRKIFKEKELEELAQSIKENGIIQPLIISKAEKGFTLIAGERRLRAAKLAGLEKVPVVVKRGTEKEQAIMAIIENVQRSDLNCIEEALAYYSLMDEYQLTQEELSKKLGKERSSIANFLRLLQLPREVVEMLQKEQISFGHGKVLAGLKDRDLQIKFAHQVLKESYSVRELENIIKKEDKIPRAPKKGANPFFDTKLDELKTNLERKTGFHFQIKSKGNGAGVIGIKFSNEAEFNDIYDLFLRSK